MPVIDPIKELFATRSFLIVEDFEAMRNILRNLLRHSGARSVDVAMQGGDALACLQHNKYDVVLCDYYLGPGRNGQQLLEEARHQNLISPATIWIMVTGEKTSDMVMGAVEHQPDDYLLKPITEASLQTRLEKLIARKAALADIGAAIQAKEYVRALNLCKARLANDPGNPLEVLRIQGDLYELTGQPEALRKLYESILARRSVPWAKAGLAKLLFHEGNYSGARAVLEELVAENPWYVEGHDWLAKTFQRLGAWQDVERVLSRAVVVSPMSVTRQSALGDAAMRCNHLDVAEEAYGKSLKFSAQTTVKVSAPYIGLARVYTTQKKTKEALEILGQMANDCQADELKLQAKAEEVRVHHASGDTAKAEATAREVSERIQSGTQNLSPAATLDLAETFMLMGDRGTASNLLQFVVRNNHEDEELAARVQEVFEKGEMGEEGRGLVGATRREAKDSMDQGAQLAAQGKLEEALELMRQARKLMPRNPRLLLNHAYVVISLMKKTSWRYDMAAEARRSIEIARTITPGDKRCGELLAKLESLS